MTRRKARRLRVKTNAHRRMLLRLGLRLGWTFKTYADTPLWVGIHP